LRPISQYSRVNRFATPEIHGFEGSLTIRVVGRAGAGELAAGVAEDQGGAGIVERAPAPVVEPARGRDDGRLELEDVDLPDALAARALRLP